MQYSNRETISQMRSAVKISLMILCILLILSLFGDFEFLTELKNVFSCLIVALTAMSLFAGIDDVIVSLGEGYFELHSNPMVRRLGRKVNVSIHNESLMSIIHYKGPFNIMHLVKLTYMDNRGKKRTVSVGFTGVDSGRRKELITELRTICNNNIIQHNADNCSKL